MKKRGRTENLKQFKPGESGNPGGRPRTAALSQAYRAKLTEPVPGDPDGRTYAEVIADVLAAAAVKGDIRAAQELADRSEGRPKQQLEVEADLSGNWAAILIEAQRRLDAVRTIDVPALPAADDKDENSAQHTPQATHLSVAPAPAPAEKQGEGERQEPSQDGQPGYVDWVSRLAGTGSTRPSGRGGPHGWMG